MALYLHLVRSTLLVTPFTLSADTVALMRLLGIHRHRGRRTAAPHAQCLLFDLLATMHISSPEIDRQRVSIPKLDNVDRTSSRFRYIAIETR